MRRQILADASCATDQATAFGDATGVSGGGGSSASSTSGSSSTSSDRHLLQTHLELLERLRRGASGRGGALPA